VVSYDVARDIETHTHRVGRTGRAGAAGQAYTLLVNDKENNRMAALLVQNLEQANQKVPDDLQALAMKYGPFRAAKLEGRDFYAKKRGTIGGQAEKSAFGLGFDNGTRQKETAQDLAKRLDKEADQMAVLNRQKMLGPKGRGKAGRGRGMKGSGHSGFVAAATDDMPTVPNQARSNDDSSDEDLFAPGVTAAFGRAPPPVQPAPAFQPQVQQWQQFQQAAQAPMPVMHNPAPTPDLTSAPAAPRRVFRGFSDGLPSTPEPSSSPPASAPQSGFSRGFSDGASRPRERSRSRSRGRRERSRSRGRRRPRSRSLSF